MRTVHTTDMLTCSHRQRLNRNKRELFADKDDVIPSICNIPVKEKVTYIGITISKDQQERCSLNVIPIIEKN